MGFENGMAAIAAVYQDTTNTLQVGLTTANTLTLTNSSTTDALTITQTGVADAIFIDQDANAPSINIDSEATSSDVINIDAANTSGVVVDVNLSPGVTSTANALTIDNDGNCTANLVNLTNAGTGKAFYINQTGELATNNTAFDIRSGTAQINSPLAYFALNNSGSTQNLISLYQNGTNHTLYINHDSNAEAIEIDMDSDSASDTYAIKIVSDNAGAGTGCGIDASGFSQDEPIFKFPSDDGGGTPSSGALSHQVAIDIGGTTYYLYAYTHVV